MSPLSTLCCLPCWNSVVSARIGQLVGWTKETVTEFLWVHVLEAEERIWNGKDIITWILRNRFRKLVLTWTGLQRVNRARIMMPKAWLVVLLVKLDEAVRVFEWTLAPPPHIWICLRFCHLVRVTVVASKRDWLSKKIICGVTWTRKKYYPCEICVSLGGEFEDYSLIGCK